jgi:hypothetical protein
MVGAAAAVKERVDHEVAAEDATARNTLSDIFAYPGRMRTLQDPDFSIDERALNSNIDFASLSKSFGSLGIQARLFFPS